MVRKATANWMGSGKEGTGKVSTQSGVLNNNNYSYHTRFEDGVGTNPEELIAAAHAGCFSMKLSFVLGAAGFTPTSIDTTCAITLDAGVIKTSALTVRAVVPGITADQFLTCAEEAKTNCPVSKLLNAELQLDAALG
jgi:osmotically inducible protein OsmC